MKEKMISEATLVSGMRGNGLAVIAGYGSRGKTSLALSMAVENAIAKKPTVFFSLEHSKYYLEERLSGFVKPEDIANLPLHIHDKHAITFQELERYIREARNGKNVKTVFVDYIGLLTMGDDTRNQADVLQQLNYLASELKITIFAVVQMGWHLIMEPSPEAVESSITMLEATMCIDRLFMLNKIKGDTETALTVYDFGTSKWYFSERNKWIKENIISVKTLVSAMRGNDLAVIAATPSTGKTSLALSMALQSALDKKRVAFISLDPKANVWETYSMLATVDYFEILTSPIPYEREMTFQELELHIRELCDDKNVDTVFVDHIGLLGGDARDQAAVLMQLKALAVELNVAIFAVVPIRKDVGKELTPEAVESEIASGEEFRYIDSLLLLHKMDNTETTLSIYDKFPLFGWMRGWNWNGILGQGLVRASVSWEETQEYMQELFEEFCFLVGHRFFDFDLSADIDGIQRLISVLVNSIEKNLFISLPPSKFKSTTPPNSGVVRSKYNQQPRHEWRGMLFW